MTSMWDYQQDVGGGTDRDFVGYDVEATDGGIGKIDEASNEAGSAYLVVDTGFWIFGKKRMIPAGVIDRVDRRQPQGVRGDVEGRHQVRPRLQRSGSRRPRPLRHLLRTVRPPTVR